MKRRWIPIVLLVFCGAGGSASLARTNTVHVPAAGAQPAKLYLSALKSWSPPPRALKIEIDDSPRIVSTERSPVIDSEFAEHGNDDKVESRAQGRTYPRLIRLGGFDLPAAVDANKYPLLAAGDLYAEIRLRLADVPAGCRNARRTMNHLGLRNEQEREQFWHLLEDRDQAFGCFRYSDMRRPTSFQPGPRRHFVPTQLGPFLVNVFRRAFADELALAESERSHLVVGSWVTVPSTIDGDFPIEWEFDSPTLVGRIEARVPARGNRRPRFIVTLFRPETYDTPVNPGEGVVVSVDILQVQGMVDL